ncbi:MAG TPA: hypothetical protein VGH37_16695 [Candidatus Acidoferrum sp.]
MSIIETRLDRAQKLTEQLESLVVKRGECPDDERHVLVIAYWSLLFDFHKAILNLVHKKLYGSAFALIRPSLEALVRAHLAVKGTSEDVAALRSDEYKTNFGTIGPWIDKEFGTEDLFTNLFIRGKVALHSYTHAGTAQLSRRFDGHNLEQSYKEGEILEVINLSTSATWMITNLVTKFMNFKEEAETSDKLWLEWG